MKILVAYKPTAEGEAALEAAQREARLRDARLLLVRHVALAADASSSVPPTGPETGRRERPSRAGQDVDKLWEELTAREQELRAAGFDCEARVLTDRHDAAEALLEVARSEDVGLIVLGVRRRSPVGKLVLGSTAQDVLLHADSPVLAVKA